MRYIQSHWNLEKGLKKSNFYRCDAASTCQMTSFRVKTHQMATGQTTFHQMIPCKTCPRYFATYLTSLNNAPYILPVRDFVTKVRTRHWTLYNCTALCSRLNDLRFCFIRLFDELVLWRSTTKTFLALNQKQQVKHHWTRFEKWHLSLVFMISRFVGQSDIFSGN